MKFAVLGLGESLNSFKQEPSVNTIGCNDIYKYVATDYIVCCDPRRVFTPERLKTIETSTPLVFFSFFQEWKSSFIGNFELMQKSKVSGSLKTLQDRNNVCFSISSAFVACVKAYHLGAKEITMYGVDFNSHKELSKPEKLNRITKDFLNLHRELSYKGVCLQLGSNKSYLAKFIPVKRC